MVSRLDAKVQSNDAVLARTNGAGCTFHILHLFLQGPAACLRFACFFSPVRCFFARVTLRKSASRDFQSGFQIKLIDLVKSFLAVANFRLDTAENESLKVCEELELDRIGIELG